MNHPEPFNELHYRAKPPDALSGKNGNNLS